MTEETTVSTDPRESLNLKLVEPEVSSDSPWGDDVLNRAEIASRLTNLIRTQSVPFVVSIDGYWGTGKTFMLKRWQKDLENQDFRAIYFNAWEDDFCDDPLLAIFGQLSEYFNEDEDFGAKARRAFEIAIPLLRQNAMNIATGLLERQVGISGLTLEVEQDGESNRDLLQEYRDQRATKVTLKERLTELSNDVMQSTGHPLVFIIDELDRCRPTFAIELLERVKHIFEVPNLVFVFGINRDELCKSLQSIYGEIDADVYLRRFFDMEFRLPPVDSRVFCSHLLQKFDLDSFFTTMSRNANANIHQEDFQQLSVRIPEFWNPFGLSLRDLDHCVRLISLVGKSLNSRHRTYPWLLGLLILLKINNTGLYGRFIRGECLASEVMNYLHSVIPEDAGYTVLARTLALIEGDLYVIESQSNAATSPSTALAQFELLKSGSALTHPEYLSERIKQTDTRGIESLDETIRYAQGFGQGISSSTLGYIAEMIDLHQSTLRR